MLLLQTRGGLFILKAVVRGTDMTIADWFAENLFGKGDPAIIYDGMAVKERRNKRKRTLHIEERRRLTMAASDATFAHVRPGGRRSTADFVEHYKCYVRKEVYRNTETALRTANRSVQEAVFKALYDHIHPTMEVEDPSWQQALEGLKREPDIVQLVPGLFDGQFGSGWKAVQPARRKALEEQEAEERRKREQREAEAKERAARTANIRAAITRLEDDLRSLNSIYYASQGADQMTRYKLVISIESTEQAIERMKAML